MHNHTTDKACMVFNKNSKSNSQIMSLNGLSTANTTINHNQSINKLTNQLVQNSIQNSLKS